MCVFLKLAPRADAFLVVSAVGIQRANEREVKSSFILKAQRRVLQIILGLTVLCWFCSLSWIIDITENNPQLLTTRPGILSRITHTETRIVRGNTAV